MGDIHGLGLGIQTLCLFQEYDSDSIFDEELMSILESTVRLSSFCARFRQHLFCQERGELNDKVSLSPPEELPLG